MSLQVSGSLAIGHVIYFLKIIGAAMVLCFTGFNRGTEMSWQ